MEIVYFMEILEYFHSMDILIIHGYSQNPWNFMTKLIPCNYWLFSPWDSPYVSPWVFSMEDINPLNIRVLDDMR